MPISGGKGRLASSFLCRKGKKPKKRGEKMECAKKWQSEKSTKNMPKPAAKKQAKQVPTPQAKVPKPTAKKPVEEEFEEEVEQETDTE